MPRKKRLKSKTGIYHIMMRGINKQIIFEDDEDFARYIQTLNLYKEKSKFEIYAYCLMQNHIHLLLKELEEGIPNIMKRIGASYVYWYNKKYNRIGHLFQGRYRSEPIEDEIYLKTVLRYIHQNPVKAGYVKRCEDYQWSSYLSEGQSLWLSFFSEDKITGIETYKQFHIENEKTECIDINSEKRIINDLNAKDILKEICGIKNCKELQRQEKEMRDENIRKLLKIGLSMRQISRLTGISRKI